MMTPLEQLSATYSQLTQRVNTLEALETSTLPVINVAETGILGTGGADELLSWRSLLTGAGATGQRRIVYMPEGDFILDSMIAGATSRYNETLVIPTGVTLTGHPQARFILRDGCASSPILFRNATDAAITMVQVIDQRTTIGSGIVLQNSSTVLVDRCIVKDCKQYGIAVTEDTAQNRITSSDIVFTAATKRLTSASKALTGFAVGNVIYIAGSISNNGFFNVTVVDVDNGGLTVSNTVVDEAAGATKIYVVDNGITFDATTNSINGPVNAFASFSDDFQVMVSGSSLNNGLLTINYVSDDNSQLIIVEPIITEALGLTITIQQVARVGIETWVAAACDNVTITNNWVENCGIIGIEYFPKAESINGVIDSNYVVRCGFSISGGCGIKPGQAAENGSCRKNVVVHCQNGMGVGNYHTLVLEQNVLMNCAQFGIFITQNNHIKYVGTLASLLCRHNTLIYTHAFFTDAALGCVEGVQYTAPRTGYHGINVNGLRVVDGMLEISDNLIVKWNAGIGMTRMLVPQTNLHWLRNTIQNSGQSTWKVTAYTIDTTNTNTTISNIIYTGTGAASTIGLYPGVELVGAGLQAGTVIVSVDPSAKTAVISLPATATAAAVAITTRACIGAEIAGNRWINTDATANVTVQVYSEDGRVVGNEFRGMAAYALGVQGDGLLARDNYFTDINRLLTANRGAILVQGAGTYDILDNHYEGGTGGTLAYFINNTLGTTVNAWGNTSTLDTMHTFIDQTKDLNPTLWEQRGAGRVIVAAAAPTSGQHYIGDIVINSSPTSLLNIERWVCVATGTPGTFRAHGEGSGTTAQRPAGLTTGDAEYQYRNSTTGNLEVWSGSAWVVISNLSKARYTSAAAQSLANATTTLIQFDTIDYDPSTLVVTGAAWAFTATETGYYRVTAALMFVASTAWAQGTKDGRMFVSVNGGLTAWLDWDDSKLAGTLMIMRLHGTSTVFVTAGQTIQIKARQSTGGALTLNADPLHNWICIEKV